MKHYLLVLLLGFSTLVAQTADEREARRAMFLFEVGKFEQARAIYQTLLRSSTEEWQQAFLHDNLGVIFLAEGRFVQALQEFNSIDLTQDPSPRLLRSVLSNKTVALLRYAESLDTDGPQTEEQLGELHALLEQALATVTASEAADCAFIKGEVCRPALDLVMMRRRIQDMMEKTTAKIKLWKIQHMSFVELIGTLIAHLNNSDDELQPYWEALKTKSVFDRLQPAYFRYTSAQTEETRAELVQALKKAFFAQYSKGDQTVQDLAKLRLAYAEALAGPLQREQIDALSKALQAIKTPLLTVALQQHTLGASAINEGYTQTGRLFLSMAAFWIDQALKSSLSHSEATPAAQLDEAIALENFSRSSSLAAAQLPERELKTTVQHQRLFASLNRLQEAVLVAAAQFIAQVLAKEKELYADQQCQKTPWDRVLPLFFDGEGMARQAEAGLKVESPMEWISAKQTEALRLWKEARQALTNEQEPATDFRPDEPRKPDKPLPVEERVRLLQQMESYDNPAPKPGTARAGVLRPW